MTFKKLSAVAAGLAILGLSAGFFNASPVQGAPPASTQNVLVVNGNTQPVPTVATGPTNVFTLQLSSTGEWVNESGHRLVVEVVDIALHASQFGTVAIRDGAGVLANQRQFVFPLTQIPQLAPDGLTEMGHHLTKIYVEPGQAIFVLGFSAPEAGFFLVSGYFER